MSKHYPLILRTLSHSRRRTFSEYRFCCGSICPAWISGYTSDDDDDDEEAGTTPGMPSSGSGASERLGHDDHGMVIDENALYSPSPTPQVGSTEAPNAPDDSAEEGLKPRWESPLDMLKQEVRFDSIRADNMLLTGYS